MDFARKFKGKNKSQEQKKKEEGIKKLVNASNDLLKKMNDTYNLVIKLPLDPTMNCIKNVVNVIKYNKALKIYLNPETNESIPHPNKPEILECTLKNFPKKKRKKNVTEEKYLKNTILNLKKLIITFNKLSNVFFKNHEKIMGLIDNNIQIGSKAKMNINLYMDILMEIYKKKSKVLIKTKTF